MEKEIILSPSILAADFSRLGEQLIEVKQTGTPWLHIDVMDGQFVNNISFGIPIIHSIRPITDQFFDVHLMVEEPIRILEAFALEGADGISIHVEACSNVKETLMKIKSLGKKPGLVLNPATPIETIYPYLDDVAMVLVMCVQPGFGGQVFVPETLDKIKVLRQECKNRNLSIKIQVDGGIRFDNLDQVIEAGADVIVAGTAIFQNNIKDNIMQFNQVFAQHK